MDPTGWWISEKLDGVRAYWDGKFVIFLLQSCQQILKINQNRILISRLGNPFKAPDWFTAGFPSNIKLDGELWSGRGKFQLAVSAARSDSPDGWKSLTYMIFDTLTSNDPFEARLKSLKSYFLTHKFVLFFDFYFLIIFFLIFFNFPRTKYAKIVSNEKCKGENHLMQTLKAVLKSGGEGLMLRKPNSLYASGRSNTLLKV